MTKRLYQGLQPGQQGAGLNLDFGNQCLALGWCSLRWRLNKRNPNVFGVVVIAFCTIFLQLLGQHTTASPDLIELCRRFFEAKKAFDSSDPRRAQIELQSLLKDFPEDGPSKYLLGIIERQL